VKLLYEIGRVPLWVMEFLGAFQLVHLEMVSVFTVVMGFPWLFAAVSLGVGPNDLTD
jgi:hypothetical protein